MPKYEITFSLSLLYIVTIKIAYPSAKVWEAVQDISEDCS